MPAETQITVPDLTGKIQVRNNYIKVSQEKKYPFAYIELMENSRIKIDTYSVTGEHIKKLADGTYNRGVLRISWFLDSDDGKRVPSGLYFLAVKVNDEKPVIGKIVIVR